MEKQEFRKCIAPYIPLLQANSHFDQPWIECPRFSIGSNIFFQPITFLNMTNKILALLLGLSVTQLAQAEGNEGVWVGNAALSFSRSAGNTSSTTYSAAVDEVRTTQSNKIFAYLSALYGNSQGVKSADKARLGSRYDHNLSNNIFGFGLLEFEKDSLANLSLRTAGGTGLGYYFIKNDVNSFDAFSGFSYSQSDMTVGKTTSNTEILLGEESNHKLSDNTRFKQKLSYYPSMEKSGQFRSLFESGLVVDLNSTMGLSISLQNKYTSDVGAGVKKIDSLLLTGLNIKL